MQDNNNRKKTFTLQANWLDYHGMGVHRYAWNILKELDLLLEHSEHFNMELLLPHGVKNVPAFQNIKLVVLGRETAKRRLPLRVEKLIWKSIVFRLYCVVKRRLPVDWTLTFINGHFRLIAIHDCIVESFYHGEGWGGRRYLRRVRRVIRNPRCHIVTVSEFSKNDIMNTYHIPAQRIAVVGNGWEHICAIEEDGNALDKFGLLDKQYYFTLGNQSRHKNMKWISEAAQKNPHETFVIAGGRTRLPACGNIVYTGRLTDGEIKTLMQHCKAYIQPSFIEGFGIPPLEAMSLQAPCIVSDIPAFHEIFADSVYYIDPQCGDVILDDLLHGSVSHQQDVLDKYTWKNAAKSMYQLLSELAES